MKNKTYKILEVITLLLDAVSLVGFAAGFMLQDNNYYYASLAVLAVDIIINAFMVFGRKK